MPRTTSIHLYIAEPLIFKGCTTAAVLGDAIAPRRVPGALVSLVAARLDVPLLAGSYVTMIKCVIGSPDGAGPPSVPAHGTIMHRCCVPIGGTIR